MPYHLIAPRVLTALLFGRALGGLEVQLGLLEGRRLLLLAVRGGAQPLAQRLVHLLVISHHVKLVLVVHDGLHRLLVPLGSFPFLGGHSLGSFHLEVKK